MKNIKEEKYVDIITQVIANIVENVGSFILIQFASYTLTVVSAEKKNVLKDIPRHANG